MSSPLPDGAMRRLLAMAAERDSGAPTPGAAGSPPDDRYEMVREIGRGGMGVVFEAVDRRLGRRCALKMIHPLFGDGEELRQRLVREALAAARLRHPNIAAVYDATPDSISMQLIAGCPIGAIPRTERRLLVELIRDAARAVHHAHEQGIVHRDIKPSNLLVEGRHVFVVDFGLAKEIAANEQRTISGMVVGTPAFMAPEQARGRGPDIGPRTDVYSLGATLYACLTGAPPFQGSELVDVLRRVAEEPATPPAIDRDLDLVILKCLEKDASQRYATAAALADDLDRWLRSEPVHARRPSFAYRVSKLLERRKGLVKASLATALGAAVLTALVLVPIAWRESIARDAAAEAVELSQRMGIMLQDASMFVGLGDHPSAHHVLDGAIASAREFLARHDIPRVRFLLSRMLRARGQPDAALAELERAIAGDPALIEARFERGLMTAARHPLPAPARASAIADLRSAIEGGAVLTNVDLLYGRGELLRLEGSLEEAADMLKEVLAYEPTHVAARTSLVHVALARGDDDLARYYSVSAVDMQQGFGPIYLARERKFLPTSILGLDGALVDFSGELGDGPDNALALAHRGLVHLRRSVRLAAEGRHEEACGAAESAVQDHDAALVLHSQIAGAFNNRAVCHMQAERLLAASGDSAEAARSRASAEADLRRAIARDPELPEARYNLGLFSLRSVDLARKLGSANGVARYLDVARESLRRAKDLAAPDWPHLRACDTRLAEISANGASESRSAGKSERQRGLPAGSR